MVNLSYTPIGCWVGGMDKNGNHWFPVCLVVVMGLRFHSISWLLFSMERHDAIQWMSQCYTVWRTHYLRELFRTLYGIECYHMVLFENMKLTIMRKLVKRINKPTGGVPHRHLRSATITRRLPHW